MHPGRANLIHSVEHARKAGLASGLTRRANKERLRLLEEQLATALTLLTAKTRAEPAPEPPEVYTAKRLTGVRREIKRLEVLISKSNDPLELDRLARALTQLSNQEFDLAGRPRPGQRRPGPEPSSIPVNQVSRAPRPAAPAPAAPRSPAPRPSPVNLEALEQAPLD